MMASRVQSDESLEIFLSKFKSTIIGMELIKSVKLEPLSIDWLSEHKLSSANVLEPDTAVCKF